MQAKFWAIFENFLAIQISAYNSERQSVRWLVDTIQSKLSCCGITSKSDWEINNINFVCNDKLCGLPESCCKENIQNCGYLTNLNGTSEVENDYIFDRGCAVEISRVLVEKPVGIVVGWICIWLFMMFELFTINLVLKAENLVNEIHGKISDAKEKVIESDFLHSGLPSTKNSTLGKNSSLDSSSVPEVAPRAPFKNKAGNTATMMSVDVHEI